MNTLALKRIAPVYRWLGLCFVVGIVVAGMGLRYVWSGLADALRDNLVLAARTNDTVRMQRLVRLGVEPSSVGWEDHFTPLGAAAYSGHVEAVRLLLSRGADVNRKDDNRRTALHWAVAEGHADIASELRAAGGHE